MAGTGPASRRYRPDDLIGCTARLFERAGLDGTIAGAVADILVAADLLGYDTHGLQFVPAYLADIEQGRTRTSGEPEILNDTGGSLLLDGRMLPGQWVVLRALALAQERMGSGGHATVSIAIRHSQNISCLATYVKRAADDGLMALLTTSAPNNAMVAPHGGRSPRLSTNPIAIGIPTDGTPILIDTSTSATTNRRIERSRRTGQRLPGPWLVDNQDRPSDDPVHEGRHVLEHVGQEYQQGEENGENLRHEYQGHFLDRRQCLHQGNGQANHEANPHDRRGHQQQGKDGILCDIEYFGHAHDRFPKFALSNFQLLDS